MDVEIYSDYIEIVRKNSHEAFTPICKYGTLSFPGCCGHCLLTSEVNFRFSNL
jgi:hypothetical protein